jgi:hypothetical protein
MGFMSYAIVVGLIVLDVAAPRFRPAPEKALRQFHAQYHDGRTAEDQLMCPLILAGPAACPVIARDVKDRKQPLRRYAIGAIENLRCTDALPVLKAILQDDSEKDYFRGDALEAIWQIDHTEGETAAKAVSGRTDILGGVARSLLSGRSQPVMTYWDAFICQHD